MEREAIFHRQFAFTASCRTGYSQVSSDGQIRVNLFALLRLFAPLPVLLTTPEGTPVKSRRLLAKILVRIRERAGKTPPIGLLNALVASSRDETPPFGEEYFIFSNQLVIMSDESLLYKTETDKILGCAFTVYNNVGNGFDEAIYQEMLCIELKNHGMSAVMEYHLPVYYQGVKLEKFQKADIVVNDKIILELKAVSKLVPEHKAQLIRYLKLSGMKVGLLLNFGKAGKLEYERVVYTNTRYLDMGNIPK